MSCLVPQFFFHSFSYRPSTFYSISLSRPLFCHFSFHIIQGYSTETSRVGFLPPLFCKSEQLILPQISHCILQQRLYLATSLQKRATALTTAFCSHKYVLPNYSDYIIPLHRPTAFYYFNYFLSCFSHHIIPLHSTATNQSSLLTTSSNCILEQQLCPLSLFSPHHPTAFYSKLKLVSSLQKRVTRLEPEAGKTKPGALIISFSSPCQPECASDR